MYGKLYLNAQRLFFTIVYFKYTKNTSKTREILTDDQNHAVLSDIPRRVCVCS
jgi:hypothetical protein